MSRLLANIIDVKAQLAEARSAAHTVINQGNGIAIRAKVNRVRVLRDRLDTLTADYYAHQDRLARAKRAPTLAERARIVLGG